MFGNNSPPPDTRGLTNAACRPLGCVPGCVPVMPRIIPLGESVRILALMGGGYGGGAGVAPASGASYKLVVIGFGINKLFFSERVPVVILNHTLPWF